MLSIHKPVINNRNIVLYINLLDEVERTEVSQVQKKEKKGYKTDLEIKQ